MRKAKYGNLRPETGDWKAEELFTMKGMKRNLKPET